MIHPIFLHVILALLPVALSGQGPLDGFLKGKGALDLAPSISFNSARNFAGAGGRTFPIAYKGSMISLFAEYGLSRRVDLVATAAYVFTSNRSGLQDGGIFLKYRPLRLALNGAGQIDLLLGSGLGFPLANYAPAESGALGQKALILPARILVQWQTPPGFFFLLAGGYNVRFDRLRENDVAAIRKLRPDYTPTQPANFSSLLLKAGFPTARYYLDAWLEWQHTRTGSDFLPGQPDLPQSFGVSYTQAGGTLFYSETGKNGFFISGGYIFSGRNANRLLRLTAGMVFKFSL
ncbi:MAG: hypothetical protein IPM81_15235 [Saprospirales bacterium]|nr:hypothetical protein [Saprospirales bacterium]